MYKVTRDLGRRFWIEEVPSGIVSFVAAHFLYSGLRSFALECLAFLVTWYVFSYLHSLLIRGHDRP